MDFQLTFEVALILFATAIFAGFIDTLAGGGGLVTVPVLLLCGVPPINSLATNKFQGSAGSFAASLNMLRLRLVDLKTLRPALVLTFIGGLAGTLLVQLINVSVLDIVIPVVLLLIGLYFLLAPATGSIERSPRVSEKTYIYSILPGIAFYDGLFGPGAGSFYSLGNVALLGQQIIKATAHAKLFNFASNLASLIVFVLGGKVLWIAGLIMLCGQVTGATIGSSVMVKHGSQFIRPLIVLVCFLMVARYLYQKF